MVFGVYWFPELGVCECFGFGIFGVARFGLRYLGVGFDVVFRVGYVVWGWFGFGFCVHGGCNTRGCVYWIWCFGLVVMRQVSNWG